jgi:hypothetical protein
VKVFNDSIIQEINQNLGKRFSIINNDIIYKL